MCPGCQRACAPVAGAQYAGGEYEGRVNLPCKLNGFDINFLKMSFVQSSPSFKSKRRAF